MIKYLRKACVLLLMFLFIFRQDVFASGETVHYGSEGYLWNAGEVSQIGIYVSGEQNLISAELLVQYDPEYLEYSSGGELLQPGLIRVVMSEIWSTEGMTMLEFIPILSGNTTITISEAHIVNELNETIDTGNVSAGVNIPAVEGSSLEQIQINGNLIEGFSPDVYTYDLEVEADVENASVTILPEGKIAEISDTTLAYGQNKVDITAQNEVGNRTRYVLNIVRKNADAQSQQTQIADESENGMTEPQVINEVDSENSSHYQIFLIAVIVILIFILGILIWFKVYFSKKEKQKRIREIKKKRKNEVRSGGLGNKAENIVDTIEEDRETEISVQQVTMEFKREKDESSSIKELLIRSLKGQRSYEWFRALNRVSFDIKKGEVVGIIGTNGSGKSTLLKIISGVLQPTSGRVVTDTKKIQLLTLGTGFDMELTGKENVYLNGAIIGYSKEYIDEHYDEIVEFAELEGFMEERVKNYSSGMVSRLGFAIATMRDTPEILILDEVLSVGDIFFRKKSEAKIKEMIHGGSTVLIVSHSTSVIRNNCTKAVWIEKGVLKAIGNPKDVCAAYERMDENS